MYNHNIDTFLYVVEAGSFTAASEKAHMTPTGVQKQMDSLEKTLGVTLFKRDTRGVSLTDVGHIFLRECHRMIEVSEDVIKKTRHAANSELIPIRIGASLLNPIDRFNRICQLTPEIRRFAIDVVEYGTDINSSVPTTDQNADIAEIDFAAEQSIEYFAETDFLPFDDYKLTCAVPADHPLAKKSVLKISDLEGETLLLPARGNRRLAADFALAMEKEKPAIEVETPPLFYDMNLINRCAEEKKILVSLDCWNNLHPALINLPLEWDWTMPYGLIWKKNARKEVLDFIEAFKEALTLLQ